jgi:hypothetical protein
MTRPPPILIFPDTPTAEKLKGHHLYTIEVIEAASQAALNTLTEYDFQDTFKKWQKGWERFIGAEGDYFENDGD